jgi:Na+/proline symporter
MDFYRPMRRAATGNSPNDGRELRLARFATVAWGAVLLGIAMIARHWGPVLEAGLTIASIAYGGLLGVFLLGLLPRRIPETAAIIGMIAGIAAVINVKISTNIAFTWYVAIGTSITFAVALFVSLFLKEHPVE